MERIFVVDTARYRAGTILDRPAWWFRAWGLQAATRPLADVLATIPPDDALAAPPGLPTGLPTPLPLPATAMPPRRRAG